MNSVLFNQYKSRAEPRCHKNIAPDIIKYFANANKQIKSTPTPPDHNHQNPTDPPLNRVMLFDVEKDPEEREDIADQHPHIVKVVFIILN